MIAGVCKYLIAETFFICSVSYGWAIDRIAQPSSFDNPTHEMPASDSLYLSSGEGMIVLDELTVNAVGRKKMIDNLKPGSLTLRSSMLGEMPTLLGGGDALSALRSVSEVVTAADMSASLSVRGLPTGSNLFLSDGVRFGNPLHLLGLYSAWLPGYHDTYGITTFPAVTLSDNTSSGTINAGHDKGVDSIFSASVCIGLIESHGVITLPVCKRHPTVLRLGLRQSYIDKVFPKLLKAGTSTLGYAFTDAAIGLQSQLSDTDMIEINVSGSHDALSMHNDVVGEKEARAGWSNIAAGMVWSHSRLAVGAGFTWFANRFETEEGYQSVKLPASLTEAKIYGDYCLRHGWGLHIDTHVRHVSGQVNTALEGNMAIEAPGRSTAYELNPAFHWQRWLLPRLSLDAGLRMSVYMCGEKEGLYTAAVPQPRVAFEYLLPAGLSLSLRYARMARFDRLVEESATGMPINFFINAGRDVRYEDNNSFEIELTGRIPVVWMDWKVTGYYILTGNAAEYGGGLLNFGSVNYDPLDDLYFGHGYSMGLSAMIMRQIGPLRGRLNYRVGKAKVLIPHFSDSYFPSVNDRTHDLSLNIAWDFLRGFKLAANFAYATGTPYTKAKYGYIIGENLICEYYPHNSSRLPAYKRLDLSLTYSLRRKRCSHEFNVSVYNALASRNTLFIFNAYSPETGVTIKESVMKNVIPSIAYTVCF